MQRDNLDLTHWLQTRPPTPPSTRPPANPKPIKARSSHPIQTSIPPAPFRPICTTWPLASGSRPASASRRASRAQRPESCCHTRQTSRACSSQVRRGGGERHVAHERNKRSTPSTHMSLALTPITSPPPVHPRRPALHNRQLPLGRAPHPRVPRHSLDRPNCRLQRHLIFPVCIRPPAAGGAARQARGRPGDRRRAEGGRAAGLRDRRQHVDWARLPPICG
jgi:hypothetical protein